MALCGSAESNTAGRASRFVYRMDARSSRPTQKSQDEPTRITSEVRT